MNHEHCGYPMKSRDDKFAIVVDDRCMHHFTTEAMFRSYFPLVKQTYPRGKVEGHKIEQKAA